MADKTLQYKVKADTSQSIKSIGQLENEIEKLNEQIKDVDNRDEFNKLAGKIANATSELKSLELQFEGLDTEQKASEFGSFASGLADTATGAIALSQAMGLTNDATGESVETLIQGFAVANAFRSGIEGIISAQKLLRASAIAGKLVTDASTASKLLNAEADVTQAGTSAVATAATGAQTTATGAASVAMGILNAIMAANPIFLLIGGIALLVGAFALFGSSSASAAKEQSKLNAQLELVNKALERQNDILDDNLADDQKRLGNQNKIIDGEIKMLQAIKNRSKEQEDLLNKKLAEREANEIEGLNLSIDNADKKTKEFAKSFELQFKLIDNAIKQTDIEDGVNDINYDKVGGEIKNFKSQLDSILNSDLGTEDKVAALQKLEGQFQKVSGKLSNYNLQLGEAEQEKFGDVIKGFESIGDLISKNTDSLRLYNGAIQDKGNVIALKEQETSIEDLQKREAQREKARDQAAEARKKRQEADKKRIEDLQNLQDSFWLRQQSTEDQAVIIRQQQLDKELEIAAKDADLQVQLIEEAEKSITEIRASFAAERQAKRDEDAAIQIAKEDEQFALLQSIKNTEKENEIAALVADYEAKYALALGNDELELALQAEQKVKLSEIESTYRQQQLDEEAAAAEAKKQLAQDELNTKVGIAEDYANAANSLAEGIFAISNSLGKQDEKSKDERAKRQFNIQKALNLSLAGIDAFKAITSSLAQAPIAIGPIPNPAGIASLVFAGVTSVANIAKIAAAKYKGGASGGGSAPASASAGSANIPAAASLNNSTLFSTGGNPDELIKSKTAKAETPVIKAIVVESDITNAQSNVKSVKETASI